MTSFPSSNYNLNQRRRSCECCLHDSAVAYTSVIRGNPISVHEVNIQSRKKLKGVEFVLLCIFLIPACWDDEQQQKQPEN